MTDPDERSPYLNRELSWLEFNARVLALAEDPATPLLERVKFLAIFSQNLDEFFQVRVAGLKDRVAAGVTRRSIGAGTSAGRTCREVVVACRRGIRDRHVERADKTGHERNQAAIHVRDANATRFGNTNRTGTSTCIHTGGDRDAGEFRRNSEVSLIGNRASARGVVDGHRIHGGTALRARRRRRRPERQGLGLSPTREQHQRRQGAKVSHHFHLDRTPRFKN